MAIAFVNSADLGNNGGTTNSLSASYTVGSGTNRLLVVGLAGDVVAGHDDITSVTYNGVAMTLVRKLGAGGGYTDRFIYLYYLLNPASGSHTVAISCTNNHYLLAVVADYTGVQQSAQPDATASNVGGTSSASLTTAITVVAANSWPVLLAYGYSNGSAITAGAGDVRRTFGVAFGEPALFDSNGPVASGSYSMTVNPASTPTLQGLGAIVASFAPDTGTVSDVDELPVGASWLAGANPNGAIMFVARKAMTITALEGLVVTAAGAVATVSVNKVSGGVSTVIHSGSFNANGTALALQTLTLTVTTLAAGDFLQLSSTGAFTVSAANLTVFVQ
jgi:hypothetical protein